MSTMTSVQIYKQQTQILAYIDLVIGAGSLIALTALSIKFLEDLKDYINQPSKEYIYMAIYALFVMCIVAEIVLALLMLKSAKINRPYPFGREILIATKVFLFVISLCCVIILFWFKLLLAGIIGAFILKYKLYAFWVLWSVPHSHRYVTASVGGEADKVFIIGEQQV